ISGAVTALGDTLFPVKSLIEGVQQDLSPTAHFLIRLRIFHPMIAIATTGYLIFIALIARRSRPGGTTLQLAHVLIGLVVAELALGSLNLYLLAPMWMQILHLLFADLVWITLILFSASALRMDAAALQKDAENIGMIRAELLP